MTKREKKPISGMILGISGLILTGWMIYSQSPDNWIIELVVIITAMISVFFISSWLLKTMRWGIILTVLFFGILILQRLGVLDILTVILLVAILGLISLIY